MPDPLTFDELDDAADVFRTEGPNPLGRWRAYQGRILELPSWFNRTLDPYSKAYRQQQWQLWRQICGSDAEYDAHRDEQTPEIAEIDAVRYPGFYSRRDSGAVASAGDHIIAIGHLLKQSRLQAGNRALEYGAGFGQLALTLARLGVSVDTIDINPLFNAAVQAQADHFDVPVSTFLGEFGDNPRPGSHYDAVFFYEAFHHCADTAVLLDKLRGMLSPQGGVLMAGEPIAEATPAIPYPWGVRLDAETVAVMRWRRWLELGYEEDFLARLFIHNGFVWTKYPCAISHYGVVHAFHLRPNRIEMSSYAIPEAQAAGWHEPEATGRWTMAQGVLPIDTTSTYATVSICLANYHPSPVDYQLACGDWRGTGRLNTGIPTVVAIPRMEGARTVMVSSTPTVPTSYGVADARSLGVFVLWFDYGEPP